MKVDSTSNKLTANFSTERLTRVGAKETIEKCYREKELTFSYATNWGEYTQGEGCVIEDIFTMSYDREEYVYDDM